jgi:exodeoxyribonuclease VII small subunit
MKEQTYEEAMKQLEKITSQIESGELDIDHLCDQLKEAQKLIKFCKDKLYKTDENVQKILESVTNK